MRLLAAAIVALLAGAAPALAQTITAAAYADPTDRYDHGVLGDAIEWGALVLTTDDGRRLRLSLPETRVFEDVAPRLADLDGDGTAEVITVESDLSRGARLAIYGTDGLIAATPFIGQPYRWLAPIGAADLDGDGRIEVAYVDRPHLARLIRVWRFDSGALTLVGEAAGFTNHRIGESDIAGGIRDCGNGPEMIVADAAWQRVVALTFDGREFGVRDVGPHNGRASFSQAMACR